MQIRKTRNKKENRRKIQNAGGLAAKLEAK
jgi:hypothetical protein